MAPFHSHSTFAEFIATDDELPIFRRFDRLNARNLLYLQSELIALEAQLEALDYDDAEDGSMDVMQSAKCWETLLLRAEEYPRETERLELIRKVRTVIREYNEALILHHQLLKIRRPKARLWNVFSNWFLEMQPFVGHSRDLLREKTDFIALNGSFDYDQLSGILDYWTGKFFALLIKSVKGTKQDPEVKAGPIYYSDKSVKHIVTIVAVVLTTLALEAPIVALYLVSSDQIRFGLIAFFTITFATAISFLSHARLVELFGASAAYAAVLVVFLASNFNAGDKNGV